MNHYQDFKEKELERLRRCFRENIEIYLKTEFQRYVFAESIMRNIYELTKRDPKPYELSTN